MIEETTQLARLSMMRTELSQIVCVDEFKEVCDKAEAIRGYAKRAGLGLAVQNMAAELKIRAQRGAGGLLAESPEFGRGKKCSTVRHLGLTRSDSSRWQAIARIPEDEFEKHIAEVSLAKLELTTAGMLRLAKTNGGETSDCCTEVYDCEPLDLLPRDHFGCIYADPPWPYQNQGTRAAASRHYPTMSLDDICSLPVGERAAGESHLWLWTTNGFLRDSFTVMDAWGFDYKSVMVWVKPQMGIGNYLRLSHEFLMLATRGGLTGRSTSQRSVIEHDRMGHSQKPEVFRRAAEAVSPGPYLELFGRRQSEGWTVWGNQVERTLI